MTDLSAEERLKRIAAWYVHYRNDEGNGYAPLDGFYDLLGMTQQELTDAYYSDDRLEEWEQADRDMMDNWAKWEKEHPSE